jgi:PilZ domain
MPVNERRQHFRVDDTLFFDYRLLEEDVFVSEKALCEELLGQNQHKYKEATEYFKQMDDELTHLSQQIAQKDSSLAHYLNLLNTKLDFLARHWLVGEHIKQHQVNISLGGIAFRTQQEIKANSKAKILFYTKPQMIPILCNTTVISCIPIPQKRYRISMQFDGLTKEQEQLLSQHIMMAQLRVKMSG